MRRLSKLTAPRDYIRRQLDDVKGYGGITADTKRLLGHRMGVPVPHDLDGTIGNLAVTIESRENPTDSRVGILNFYAVV